MTDLSTPHADSRDRLAHRTLAWVESAFDPVACLDLDLCVEYANPAFGRFVGIDASACVGRAWADLCHTLPVDAVIAQIRRCGNERNRQDGEHITADGRVVAMGARPDEDADGVLIGYVVALRDITAQRRTEERLRDRETDFRTLAESSPDVILRYDLSGLATYANRQIELALGVRHADLLGRRPGAGGSIGAGQIAEFRRLVDVALQRGESGSIELTVSPRSGSSSILDVLVHPELDDAGRVCGALAIGRDVTAQVRSGQAIADKEREFRSLAENSLDHIARWSVAGEILYTNPAFAAIAGKPVAEMIGRPAHWAAEQRHLEFATVVRRVIATGEPDTVEQRVVVPHLDPSDRVHEVRLVPERDHTGEVVSVLGVGRDVTDVVLHRSELERLARTDALTGVSNRQSLYEHVPRLLDAARDAGHRVGIMLLDLDGFKHVNDRHGHRAGDELLRLVGDRLSACVRDGDLLVRLGGDEFVLVAAGVHERTDMDHLASRVRLALAEVAAADDVRAARIDASIGVVLFPDDGDSIDTLLAHADMAMYQAKRNGRGRVEYFRNELTAATERRRRIEHALADGAITGSFELHLQPVYTLGPAPRLVGAEALARWTHPELGVVPPMEFIPIAEECGRIVELGRWALHRAAQLAVELNRGRDDALRIAVNVSTLQFALDDVAAVAREAVREAGCLPEWLGIEITESLLLEDSTSVQTTLDDLRTAGIGVAIDDFGMGYSALHYLARFPVDHLKIDRSFVQGIGTSDRRTELVRAFVALARALGLTPIAEGIETDEQLDFLRSLGCDLGQGYLFSQPLPPDQFRALATGRPLPASLRGSVTSPTHRTA